MIYDNQLRLRAAERSDLPRFVEWLNDPEVIEGLVLYFPLSLAAEEDWFENLRKRPENERPLVIEVRQGDQWQPIGNCGFHNIDCRCRSAEVGIFIGEKAQWNKGYGSQAMKLLLKIGFETLNLNRIALDVYETNLRAIRSYEKVGFVHEGRKRQGMYLEGRYVDILQMSVLREEWFASLKQS
jgi:RimJ/RimL family protein N-acetyltransferase